MKAIRKYIACALACLSLFMVLPQFAFAANRREPAGYISEVNSVFNIPAPGRPLPTSAVNYIDNTVVTAAWSPGGNVAVDRAYDYTIKLDLGDGSGYPLYVYSEYGTVDIALAFPSGHTRQMILEDFADNSSIAWQIDRNYVTDTSTWVWGTVSYTGSVTPYHSINYDTNGGSISSTNYPTYAADGETIYTSDLPEATKPGYVFGGWEIGEDVFVNDLDIYLSDIQSPVYLRAVWEAEPVKYTLSYNANGGSGSMSSQTVTEGESTRLRTNSFTRDGYYFTGWNTKADGSGTSYGDGAYAVFYGNTTLYAQWQKYADYVVSFDKNDGSGESYSQTIAYGESAALKANSFSRPGYIFTGWNTKADGTGTGYSNGATVKPSSDLRLYAQWRAETFQISFDPNGGSGSMESKTVQNGVATNLPANSFTRAKYTFTGWNTKADGSGTSYVDGAVVTFTQDMLLYAQWKLEPDYAVVIPDGDEIVIDPCTLTGEAIIGVQIQSVIPEDRQLRMSVNAGTHYDDAAQSYRLRNNTGGQYTAYELAYKGSPVNPGGSGNTAVLELADSDTVFAGFQNMVSVKTAAARTAGRHTDLLTFNFAIV